MCIKNNKKEVLKFRYYLNTFCKALCLPLPLTIYQGNVLCWLPYINRKKYSHLSSYVKITLRGWYVKPKWHTLKISLKTLYKGGPPVPTDWVQGSPMCIPSRGEGSGASLGLLIPYQVFKTALPVFPKNFEVMYFSSNTQSEPSSGHGWVSAASAGLRPPSRGKGRRASLTSRG